MPQKCWSGSCSIKRFTGVINITVHFKNVNNYLNTNIYSYIDTSGGKSSNLYLHVVHFFNASVN